MPTLDVPSLVDDTERERDRDRDLDRHDRADKLGPKQKPALASTKSKDLSHVPCKFFKVGACTAGPSCPFSHASAEPGAQKEPCAWFVKGNCKFGHKCALAHILPGQNMSMDRKNKKAAQQAAAATGGSDKGGKESRKKRDGQVGNSGSAPGRNNTLLGGGSTAPTRLGSSTSPAPSSSRAHMPLMASISPSAPAPPLKDTDFASFAALDEMEGVQLPAPPAHGISQAAEAGASTDAVTDADGPSQSTPSPVPLPTSDPRVTTAMSPSEFGPIGSPPSASRVHQSTAGAHRGTFTPTTSPRGPSHLNGVNLSTSPQNGPGFISGSPFSTPGKQSVFLNSSYAGHGVAASLGSGLAMMGGRRGWRDTDVSASPASGGLSMFTSSVQRSSLLNGNARGEYGIELEYEEAKKGGTAVENGDMEDFIPGSLTDLLTPEERSRRMSRSGSSGRPLASALSANAPSHPIPGDQLTATSGNRPGHRYSSSVPAPSLLGDIKSIWSDASVVPLPGSPSAQPTHRVTPSAPFTSRFEGLTVGSHQGSDDMGLSMSMGSTGAASSHGVLSPSNASAAFLPGIHHNYLKSKTSQQTQLGLGMGAATGHSRGMRGPSGPLYPSGNTSGNFVPANYISNQNSNQGFPPPANAQSNVPQLPSYRGAPSPFDLTQPMHQSHSQPSRPIPTSDGKRLGPGLGLVNIGGTGGSEGPGTNGGSGVSGAGNDIAGLEGEMMTGQLLSPNTRALQAHAPGQSLPQGLAAGYSRIHALPPQASLASPNVNNGGAFPSSIMDNGFGFGSAAASGQGAAALGMSFARNAATTVSIREEWGTPPLPAQKSPLAGPITGNNSNGPTPAPPNQTTSNASGGPTGSHATSTLNPVYSIGVPGASPGLESVLSKLSYSAAAKGGSVSNSPTPPGLTKGAVGRYAPGLRTPVIGEHGAQVVSSSSSPLKPRDDDDDLFAMDK